MPAKSVNLVVNLPQELDIGKPIRHEHSLELPVTPPKVVPVCPHCHSAGCVSKGSDGFQSIRHVPSGNVGVFLTFKKQRFYCPECRASFTYHYPWQHHPLPITDALYLSILSDLSRPVPIPDIAAKNCVTDNIVRGVLKSIDIPRSPALPEIICVDDFRGNAGAYNPKRKKWDAPVFQTCVVDGASGRIIDILRDRSSATVQEFFLSFPESQRKNVKFYSCDMSGIYAAAARKIFPDAILCVDRFHVVQWLNKAVDAVRCRLQNEFRNIPAKYSKLKDSRLMLLTKECNQRTYWEAYGYEEKLARLQALLAEFPDLCEVFDALQEYHFICTADTEPIRRLRLTEWINKYLSSEVGEVRDAAKTVQNWKENILNSFTHGITNGPVEALNSQIKRLKKISCGVHDLVGRRTPYEVRPLQNRTCDFLASGSLQNESCTPLSTVYTNINLRTRQWVYLTHLCELFPCIAFFLTSPVQPVEQAPFYPVAKFVYCVKVVSNPVIVIVTNKYFIELFHNQF